MALVLSSPQQLRAAFKPLQAEVAAVAEAARNGLLHSSVTDGPSLARFCRQRLEAGQRLAAVSVLLAAATRCAAHPGRVPQLVVSLSLYFGLGFTENDFSASSLPPPPLLSASVLACCGVLFLSVDGVPVTSLFDVSGFRLGASEQVVAGLGTHFETRG